MFERFTDRARMATVAAQEESRRLHHGYVGTEHVLLGLTAGDGIAARALHQIGFDRERFEQALLDQVPRGLDVPAGHIPFTPRSKKTLERALRQSLNWGHNYIGTEHLLVGLLQDDTALATKLAAEQGLSAEAVEAVVLKLLVTHGLAPADDAGDDVGGGVATTEPPATGPTTQDEARAAAVGFDALGSEVQGARCPACREPLATNLAADLVLSIGELERMFAVAYCSACGHTLTVVPDD